MGTIRKCLPMAGSYTILRSTTTFLTYRITTTTEDYTFVNAPKCTVVFFGINLRLNTVSGASSLNLRKNGSQIDTLSIPAGATGLQSKTVSIQIEEGDRLSLQLAVGTGTGATGVIVRGGGVVYE